MQCYKCTTTDNLSIKKHDRQGNPVYICKQCRNQAYRQYKQRQQPSARDITPVTDTWTLRALESYNRISNKYKSIQT